MLTMPVWRSVKMDSIEPDLARIVSLSMQYPDAELLQLAADMRLATERLRQKSCRNTLLRFLDWWEATAPTTAAGHYVDTFDLNSACSPYLTCYLYDDPRHRGEALAELQARYRIAGLELVGGELADHLAVVLEYAAIDPAGGGRVIQEMRPGIELIRRRLSACDSPYAWPLDALCDSLPRLGPAHRVELRRLAAREPRIESCPAPLAPVEEREEAGLGGKHG